MNLEDREKLIEEIEFLRQGFKDALNFMARTPAEKMTADALHKNADRLVAELGGEAIREDNQEIFRKY